MQHHFVIIAQQKLKTELNHVISTVVIGSKTRKKIQTVIVDNGFKKNVQMSHCVKIIKNNCRTSIHHLNKIIPVQYNTKLHTVATVFYRIVKLRHKRTDFSALANSRFL